MRGETRRTAGAHKRGRGVGGMKPPDPPPEAQFSAAQSFHGFAFPSDSSRMMTDINKRGLGRGGEGVELDRGRQGVA